MTGRANHAGQVSVPNVILRFSYIRHRSLPPRAFNRMPQSSGLGRTSAGAYTFSGNVVLEALRVVNRARGFPQTATSRLVRV